MTQKLGCTGPRHAQGASEMTTGPAGQPAIAPRLEERKLIDSPHRGTDSSSSHELQLAAMSSTPQRPTSTG